MGLFIIKKSFSFRNVIVQPPKRVVHRNTTWFVIMMKSFSPGRTKRKSSQVWLAKTCERVASRVASRCNSSQVSTSQCKWAKQASSRLAWLSFYPNTEPGPRLHFRVFNNLGVEAKSLAPDSRCQFYVERCRVDKKLYPTLSLSTQGYKWSPGDIQLEITLIKPGEPPMANVALPFYVGSPRQPPWAELSQRSVLCVLTWFHVK